jgi:hypothetical protein
MDGTFEMIVFRKKLAIRARDLMQALSGFDTVSKCTHHTPNCAANQQPSKNEANWHEERLNRFDQWT